MTVLGELATQGNVRGNRVFAMAMAAIAVGCAVYLFQFRYYLRMVPIPLSMIGYVYGANGPATRFTPRGTLDMPDFDLRTEAGLRAALDHIRSLSPTAAVSGMTQYTDVSFSRWAE